MYDTKNKLNELTGSKAVAFVVQNLWKSKAIQIADTIIFDENGKMSEWMFTYNDCDSDDEYSSVILKRNKIKCRKPQLLLKRCQMRAKQRKTAGFMVIIIIKAPSNYF